MISTVSTSTTVALNRGLGAGGANTNLYGKKFEDITNNESRLLANGFEKVAINNTRFGYYLSKKTHDRTMNFVLQSGLKTYMKKNHAIDLFRCPDEAYIIEYNDGKCEIKILEKKEQRVEGSVETKLWSGPSLKQEYEILLDGRFNVDYAFCVSSFLQTKFQSGDKKYTILSEILRRSNINVLFGDDSDYFQKLDEWVKFI
jgi:hypothetical protein